MSLSSVSILAVVITAFYGVAFFLNLGAAFVQGFRRNGPWLYMAFACLVRIAAGATNLALRSFQSRGLFIAFVVLNHIGPSIIIYTFAEMLARLNSPIEKRRRRIPPFVARGAIGFFVVAGVAVDIAGIVNEAIGNSSQQSQGPTELKAGDFSFLAAWVVTCMAWTFTTLNARQIAKGEIRLIVAIGAALPFLLVHYVYNLIIDFLPINGFFNLFFPNPWVQGFLSTLEEFAATILIVIAGYITNWIPPSMVRGRAQANANIMRNGVMVEWGGDSPEMSMAQPRGVLDPSLPQLHDEQVVPPPPGYEQMVGPPPPQLHEMPTRGLDSYGNDSQTQHLLSQPVPQPMSSQQPSSHPSPQQPVPEPEEAAFPRGHSRAASPDFIASSFYSSDSAERSSRGHQRSRSLMSDPDLEPYLSYYGGSDSNDFAQPLSPPPPMPPVPTEPTTAETLGRKATRRSSGVPGAATRPVDSHPAMARGYSFSRPFSNDHPRVSTERGAFNRPETGRFYQPRR